MLRTGVPEEVGMSPQRVAKLRALGKKWVGEEISALALLVARHGVIVLDEAYGSTSSDSSARPLRQDDIFLLASLSKPLTATLVMQLVEDGLIGLNDPVQQYLPEFRGEGKEDVLVFHLLTHTSGIRSEDLPAPGSFFAGLALDGLKEPELALIPLQLLDLSWDVPLHWPPGTQMAYENHNYNLLGEILRRVSGQSLADLSRERLFTPLGMDDSAFGLPPGKEDRVVKMPPHFWLVGLARMLKIPMGGAGVLSTARDMAAFGQMFLNQGRYGDARVLSKASVREMTTNQIPGVPAILRRGQAKEASWGLGWGIRGDDRWKHYSGSLERRGSFGHSGGAGSMLWVSPEDGLVMAYLAYANVGAEGSLVNHYEEFINVATASIEDE